ncbi:MAG TPA: Yip1 family protein [Casimicrobiaceae bacterium]
MNPVDRVKGILLAPKTEWPRIAADSETVQSIYTGYVMLLAAIGPIMVLLSSLMFSILGFAFGIRAAIGMYVMTLITVAVIALVADLISPSFGGSKDYVRSLKLVAYSFTAVWISEIALIVPILGAIVVLIGAIYGFYLFFVGAPVLGRCSADRAVPYTIVVVLGTIVLMFVIRAVLSGVLYTPGTAGTLSFVG